MTGYYLLVDVTKDCTNEKSTFYFKQDIGEDLVGFIYNFAERNKINMIDTRLYEFKTKAEFDKSYNNWLNATRRGNAENQKAIECLAKLRYEILIDNRNEYGKEESVDLHELVEMIDNKIKELEEEK